MDPSENVVITSEKNKTRTQTNGNDELLNNVSPKDLQKFKTNIFVRYGDLGARGDGKTDDIDAIAATHVFANTHALSVKADERATYCISGKNLTAVIRTDTDFGTAAFIIDDSDVQNQFFGKVVIKYHPSDSIEVDYPDYILMMQNISGYVFSIPSDTSYQSGSQPELERHPYKVQSIVGR